jgi:hypothetical protein
LENKSVKAPKVITEALSSVTGDKSARSQERNNENERESMSNVIDLKRLAGL